MNEIFNFKRFGLLFKEQTSKNLKIFLMGSVLVFAVLFILNIILLTTSKNHQINFNTRSDIYNVFLYITAFLLSSNWFTYLSKRSPETGNLLLPASAFERILVAFIINIIIFCFIYLLICTSVEIILFQEFYILKFLIDSLDNYYNNFSILFLLQSLFLIGSLIFKKAAIIKTGFSIFVILIIFQLINSFTISVVFRDIPNFINNDVFFNQNSNLSSPIFFQYMQKYLIYLGFPLIWIASYFKIKEKQV